MADEWFIIPVETTPDGVMQPRYVDSINDIWGYTGNYYTNPSGNAVWAGRAYGRQVALDTLSSKTGVSQDDVIQKLIDSDRTETNDPESSFWMQT